MSEPFDQQQVNPLTVDERAELDRLRAEVGTLRAGRPRQRLAWRSLGAGLLLVLGCILTPVSLATVWVHNQVTDVDRFVATMGPLIREPSVQAAITDRVTDTVVGYVDVKALAEGGVDALAAQGLEPRLVEPLKGLSGPLATSVEGFIHDKVGELVASPRMAKLWDRVIRAGHVQMNAVLSGDGTTIVVSGGKVKLDLGPVIAEVKQHLVSSGFTVASRVPDVHPTVTITDASNLLKARSTYTALDRLATWLPWLTVLMLAGGVYLARQHRRALAKTGLGIAVSMLVLAAGLLVVRVIIVNAVPNRSALVAADAYDILVQFLRAGLRTALAVGVVIALGAFLAGPSTTAVGIRNGLSKGIAKLRAGGARAGLRTGPVGRWVHMYGKVLRAGAVTLAVLVFVFMDRPTGLTVLLIAVLLALCLGVIQLLDQPVDEDDDSVPA